jgi:hypothetical protein
MSRVALFLVLLPGLVLATRPWSEEEILRNSVTVSAPVRGHDPEFARNSQANSGHVPGFQANYLYEIKQTCDFVARYQFSDSSKPDSFGGIIEAEHMPTVIETDNTQEAIWIWSRWYELTGRDDYRTNIRRAWFYVLKHPAYREGIGQYVWYSVWNCGLAFFAEMKYRQVYGDTSYRIYADSCRDYCFSHPLNFTANTLHGNVTALAAGMAYAYAREQGDIGLRDTALAYGNRVRAWVEQNPSRLRTGNWAMSGGTLLWGLCRSIWQADTLAGRTWLATYADSVPYFMPSGSWNCSWNIWDANGFRAAAEISHELRYREYHQRLTDTLLGRDMDDDGGIPATWADPQTQDQTWVSTYLDFMGMDLYAAPVLEYDAGVSEIAGIDHSRIFLPGDSVRLDYIITNYGRQAVSVPVEMVFAGETTRTTIPSLGFLESETLPAGPYVLTAPGLVRISARTQAAGDTNPANDFAQESLLVRIPRTIAGSLLDTLTGQPIAAQLAFFLLGDTLPLWTVATDSTGRFAVPGFDSVWQIAADPEIPYPDRQWQFAIAGDTILDLRIATADLVLVDNDSLSRYETYYTSTFDTLGLTYHVRRHQQGPVPVSALTRTQDRLLVLYTGSTVAGTLDSADMDSLSRFLDSGGRLFLTGQNIGQELGGTAFYRQRLHARLIAPSVSLFYTFGNPADSLGAYFGQTQTAGPQGANNQTSRDQVAPDSLAQAFLLYDTATQAVAGIRCADTAGSNRLIYLGFGFEAVNRPSNHPEFMSRVDFFRECYAWLTGRSGIEDNADAARLAGVVKVYPNPSSGRVTFRIGSPGDMTRPKMGIVPAIPPRHRSARNPGLSPIFGPAVVSPDCAPNALLRIYDAAGRSVRTLNAGSSEVIWDGRDSHGRALAPGVYFYRLHVRGHDPEFAQSSQANSGHVPQRGAIRLIR